MLLQYETFIQVAAITTAIKLCLFRCDKEAIILSPVLTFSHGHQHRIEKTKKLNGEEKSADLIVEITTLTKR